MNRLTRTVYFAFIIGVLILLMASARSALVIAQENLVVMITSQEAAPYKEVLSGFRRYLTQHEASTVFEEYSLQSDPSKANQVLQEVKKKSPRVLLTVGSLATQAAVKETSEIPLIACMVVKADELQKTANATAVEIDFPLEVQFQWLQRFLPGNRSVGVLFNPRENQEKITAATKVARNLGLKLVAREVETPQALPDALDSLAKEADVLWGVTDQMVLSPQTAEPILLFSFRNRIPFTGLSTSWVKAGALYALDRDYTDLGAQCGEMALKVLQGTRASSLPPTTPRKVTYALNLKTAQQMKVEIPQSLIDGAQQVFR
jgi:putative ABC transport system substrate-binding protein